MVRVPAHLGQCAESLRRGQCEGGALVLLGNGMAQEGIGQAGEGLAASEQLPQCDAIGVDLGGGGE